MFLKHICELLVGASTLRRTKWIISGVCWILSHKLLHLEEDLMLKEGEIAILNSNNLRHLPLLLQQWTIANQHYKQIDPLLF
jgi:hypothetical protein